MNYFRLSFDDNNDGIYETDVTLTVNPMDYKCFNKAARVVGIPLLKGYAVQDSGVILEGSILELSNVYILKTDFEILYKRYTNYIRDKQTAVTGSHQYTLQDSNSALEKPLVLIGADTTDDTSLQIVDEEDILWDADLPTKVTVTTAAEAKIYFYYRKLRGNLILTDDKLEQFLVSWLDCQIEPRVTPLSTYQWAFKFICIRKLYGNSVNLT